jgi:carbonic anhydrase
LPQTARPFRESADLADRGFNYSLRMGKTISNEVLAAAQTYSTTFIPDQLTAAPTRHLVVLTCMDARLDLFRLLGLAIGDSHILRNAGGRATDDAIRSLVLSSHLLGTREYVVIHHTGCGLHQITNKKISDLVEEATGTRPDIDFAPFDDVEVSVAVDVERIRTCPLLPLDAIVWGAVYDVHTGTLRQIVSPTEISRI